MRTGCSLQSSLMSLRMPLRTPLCSLLAIAVKADMAPADTIKKVPDEAVKD